jgi:hypothetical protein
LPGSRSLSEQNRTYCCTHSLSNRRRKGVADLAIRRSLSSSERPRIGESLKPRSHPHGETRRVICGPLLTGWLVSKPHTVNSQCNPLPFRSCRSEVWSPVFLGSAHECRSNSARLPSPFLRALPSAQGHEVYKRFAHGEWRTSIRLRPQERFGELISEGNENKAWAKLRNSKPAGIKYAPLRFVAEARKPLKKVVTVFRESLRSKSRYVFEEHYFGLGFTSKAERLGEQVTLVLVSELFSAIEKGGHGTPPARRSIPRKSLPLTFATESSMTFQRGRF